MGLVSQLHLKIKKVQKELDIRIKENCGYILFEDWNKDSFEMSYFWTMQGIKSKFVLHVDFISKFTENFIQISRKSAKENVN